jgi:outer membrane immunogenic protein
MEMRRLAILGVRLLSISGSLSAASAADLPARTYTKAPVAVPVYNWTGCYIGGHIGGVVSEDRTNNAAGNIIDFSSTGFVGGGQIGCDYQFAPGWVVGVEGRAAWSSLTNTHASPVRNLITGVILPSQLTLSNDFLASATARLGYSFADRWLVFARGGAAWTHERADDAFTRPAGDFVDPSATMTPTGWTAGTGVEWAFAPHWWASVEYDYYDFGNRSILLTTTNNVTVNLSGLRDTMHTVTAGVDYYF